MKSLVDPDKQTGKEQAKIQKNKVATCEREPNWTDEG